MRCASLSCVLATAFRCGLGIEASRLDGKRFTIYHAIIKKKILKTKVSTMKKMCWLVDWSTTLIVRLHLGLPLWASRPQGHMHIQLPIGFRFVEKCNADCQIVKTLGDKRLGIFIF